MESEINKKLRNMKKSQLEVVCGKMRCPKGTKKEMVGHLLRPLRKYKMDKIPSELIDYLGKFEVDKMLDDWHRHPKGSEEIYYQNWNEDVFMLPIKH